MENEHRPDDEHRVRLLLLLDVRAVPQHHRALQGRLARHGDRRIRNRPIPTVGRGRQAEGHLQVGGRVQDGGQTVSRVRRQAGADVEGLHLFAAEHFRRHQS